MTGYPKKKREALETVLKDEVSRVAGNILRAEGFTSLTMDRIAREVGVARATLYNYFVDADEVLNFVEERAFAPVLDEIREIAASPRSPKDKLTAIATTLFDSLHRDRALALALFCKGTPEGKRAEIKAKLRTSVLEIVRAIAAEGAARGRFRHADPTLVAEYFLGAISALIDTMLYTGELRPANQVVPELMDLLLLGLQPGASGNTRTSGK